LSGLHLI